MSKVATITLRFRVHDEEAILARGRELVEEWDAPLDENALFASILASILVEYLLFSNPEVCPGGFLDYGIELMSTELKDATE